MHCRYNSNKSEKKKKIKFVLEGRILVVNSVGFGEFISNKDPVAALPVSRENSGAKHPVI